MTWIPIISDELHDKAIKKIEDIASSLEDFGIHKMQNLGLMGGLSGFVIFYLYYYLATQKDEYLEKALDLLEIAFEVANIQEIKNLNTFAGGIAGLGWVVEHIRMLDVVDIDTNSILDEVDHSLKGQLDLFIKEKNYDYLHGAIGIGLYFLNRTSSPIAKACISDLITALDEVAIKSSKGIVKWRMDYTLESGNYKKFNFGLSHGIPSILAFLVKAYEQGIGRIVSLPLIEGAKNYLLDNRFDVSKSYSYFPYSLGGEEEKFSRLAWCYGDLGVCLSLLHIVRVFDDVLLKNKIQEIFLFNTSRTDLVKNMVQDSGFCHGTIGIAHIFNRIFQDMQVDQFKLTANYWYRQTLKMDIFEDGLAGYKSYSPRMSQLMNKPSPWLVNAGVLEGVAGIGLSLLAATTDIEPRWDSGFFIT